MLGVVVLSRASRDDESEARRRARAGGCKLRRRPTGDEKERHVVANDGILVILDMDDEEYLLFAATANRSSVRIEEGDFDFHHHLFERDFGEEARGEEEEDANETSDVRRLKTQVSGDSTLASSGDASMESFDASRVDDGNDFKDDRVEKKSKKTKTKRKTRTPAASTTEILIDVLYCSSCKHALPAATHFKPRRKTCVDCLGYHKRYARQKRALDKRLRITYERLTG